MAMQSYAAFLLHFSQSKKDFNPGVQSTTVKEIRQPLVDFISSLRPANWFKEFSHIEISMEEFEVKRGRAVSQS